MNVTSVEKIENNSVRIAVEVDAAIFNDAVEKVFKAQRGSITVPGFRRGKAPRRIIENNYGKNVFYSDALDDTAPRAWDYAKDNIEVKIVGYPSIEGVNVDGDLTAHFEFIADLYPEVTLGEYKGLSAPRNHTDVSDAEVNAEISAIAHQRARSESVTRPAEMGDTATIDYLGTLDGVPFDGGAAEDHELKLGSNSFIVGFEQGIVGMNIGEERDLNLTFPEAYHAAELAGQDVIFHVKLKGLTADTLPELDDEFAKDVSEFDTFDEYRADLRASLERDKIAAADKAFENALLDVLANNAVVAVPDSMTAEAVDRQLQQMTSELSQYGITPEQYFAMSGLNEAQARASMKPNAEKSSKITLCLEKIAEIENIVISEEEIEALYEDTAKRFDMEIDKVKENIERKDAIHDLTLRAAIKIVRESGIPTDPHDHDHDHEHEHEHEHDHDHDHDHEKPKAKPRAKKPKAAAEPETASETVPPEAIPEAAPAKAPAKKAKAKAPASEPKAE